MPDRVALSYAESNLHVAQGEIASSKRRWTSRRLCAIVAPLLLRNTTWLGASGYQLKAQGSSLTLEITHDTLAVLLLVVLLSRIDIGSAVL